MRCRAGKLRSSWCQREVNGKLMAFDSSHLSISHWTERTVTDAVVRKMKLTGERSSWRQGEMASGHLCKVWGPAGSSALSVGNSRQSWLSLAGIYLSACSCQDLQRVLQIVKQKSLNHDGIKDASH